jgi:phosphoserine phosphatase
MKLQRLNWNQRNYDALNELLAGVRPGDIAVFDWDNTCIFNDIGEALLRRMTFDLVFKINAKTMAAMIPDTIKGVGQVMLKGKPFSLKKMREAIFLAYEKLKTGSSSAAKANSDMDYRIFTSGLLALNRALEETPGIGCEFAYPWVNTLLQGLSLSEFDRIASAVIETELRSPIGRHGRGEPLGRWRYDWISGIRLYPEMKNLAAAWQKRGGKVVVSTASNRQLVEKMIAMTGFPCRQVIGMELKMVGSRFGHALKPGLHPNLAMGKVDNIRVQLAGEPVLIAGDSSNDYEILTLFPSTRMRLVIHRHKKGKIALVSKRAQACERGYLTQKIDLKRGEFKTIGNQE